MKLHGGSGVFVEARNRRPGDRSAKSRGDLSRVSEMTDHVTPRGQVLKGLNEEHQSLAGKAKFQECWFVEDEDHRQLWMREGRWIRIAERLNREEH